LHLFKT